MKKDPAIIARMAEEAKRGRISRREFAQYSVGAGLTLNAATGLWTSAVAQSTPSRGGVFRLGTHDGNTSDSHDPGTYLSFGMIQLAHTYRSYLTLIESDNSLGPDIATEWSASADASEWTFKLNPNASFHSGSPVTADDVIASMNHHRGEDSTSAATALLSDVTEITKQDDHTVVITLGSGNADLPWLMTDYHLAICKANDDGSIDWQSGDGSGPYKVVEFQPGVSSSLERHDGWHLEGAYFDTIELTVLNDPNARQAALVTGSVDAVTQLDLKTLALLQRDPNIEIDNVPSAAAITMPMHCDTGPFDNVDVRTALKLAMDRNEIIDKIAFGTAIPGNDFHVAPNMPYWADIPQREYDPDQAKSLLKKAGAEGLTINVSTADSVYSGAVDMCVLYAEQAKAAGININVVQEPADGYWSNVWLQKPFCACYWSGRATEDWMFATAYESGVPWNDSQWDIARFQELLYSARAELDSDKRREQYLEMQMILRDEGGVLVPMFANYVQAVNNRISSPDTIGNLWQMDNARMAERWSVA